MCDHGCELALLQELHAAHVGWEIIYDWGMWDKVSARPTPTLQPHVEIHVFPTATSKTKRFRVDLQAGHAMARTTAS